MLFPIPNLLIPILHLAKIHHAMPIIMAQLNKSDFFNYDFLFKLSAITIFCSSQVTLRELDRERMTSFTYEFNFAMREPSTRFCSFRSFAVLHTKLL